MWNRADWRVWTCTSYNYQTRWLAWDYIYLPTWICYHGPHVKTWQHWTFHFARAMKRCPIFCFVLLRLYFSISVKWSHIVGLVQTCSISINKALEILQSCIKPSIWSIHLCSSRHWDNLWLSHFEDIMSETLWISYFGSIHSVWGWVLSFVLFVAEKSSTG